MTILAVFVTTGEPPPDVVEPEAPTGAPATTPYGEEE